MTIYRVDSAASIAWPTSTVVSSGDRVYATSTEGVIFECTTGGTTGGSEPTWDNTPGNTTNDNTAVWTARNFTSWLNAAQTIVAAVTDNQTTVAAGDSIWVERTGPHNENFTGNLVFPSTQNAAPVVISSRSSSDDSYAAAASAQLTLTGTTTIQNTWVMQGIYIQGAQTLSLIGSIGHAFECIFDVTKVFSNSSLRSVTLENCTVTVTDELQIADGSFIIQGGTWKMNGGSSEYIAELAFGINGYIEFDGVDFSGGSWNGNIFDNANGQQLPSFVVGRHCKFPSGFMASLVTKNRLNAIGTGPNNFTLIEHCGDGTTTTAELDAQFYLDAHGHLQADDTEKRTGGAEYDGVAHSWKITTTASTLLDPVERYRAFKSPEMGIYVAGGSEITITVFVASASTTFQDDELWIELSGPNTGSPAEPFPHRFSSLTAPAGTPANLTTDGDSSWTGTDTGSGTLQKITHTYTPGIKGLVRLKVFFAKPTTVVYIDPRIDIG